MVTVCVMMATYNGEKYIRTQIETILGQKGVRVSLYIRDDGSTDLTRDIIEAYSRQGKLRWYTGEKLGAAFSFLDLIHTMEEEYDYYAFADQDDYWKEDKLLNAVRKMQKVNDDVILYHSIVDVVDENLKSLGKKYGAVKQYNFVTELCRNNAMGCTFVFNRGLYRLIREYLPNYVSMHDQWIMLICLGVGGHILLDSNSYMLYRQHCSNAVGIKADFGTKLNQSSLKNKKGHSRLKQGRELYQGYSMHLTPKNKKNLMWILSAQETWWKRILCMKFKFNCEKEYMNWLCRYALLKKRF